MQEHILKTHCPFRGVIGDIAIGRKPTAGAYWLFWSEESGWGNADKATIYKDPARAETVMARLFRSHGMPVTPRVAFEFTCDCCGRDSYFTPQRVKPPRAMIEEYAAAQGLNVADVEMHAMLTKMPPEVTCSHCKSIFPLVPPDGGIRVPTPDPEDDGQ